MAAPTDLTTLLRLYTGKQKTATVQLQDFCDYIQKYSRHYLEEAPDLVMYLNDTVNIVTRELEELESKGKVFVSTDLKGRVNVFVPQYYIDRMISRYREIDEKPEVPFPISTELPSGFPSSFLKTIYITTDFANLLESGERTNAYLHQLNFPDETPPMIYPASLSPEKMLDLALSKIRYFLRKDESKDYIQKRMMVANPGKELTIKNALNQFQTRPSEALRALKHSGETFLFWSYLCSFIRQDYTKKNEKTPEENALIQAVFIVEYLNNYYRNKAQQDLQRETALKNLELAFQKAPYYFDMDAVTRFTDSRGVPLLGQYKESDLESFLKEKTSEPDPHTLPALLVFRTANESRFFVLREKVIQLVIRLCNDARKPIKEQITREWYQLLKSYRQESSMKSQQDFEDKIASICKSSAPILYSLLNAPFMTLLALDPATVESQSGFKMFDRGKILPLSALLMLDRQELLTDTRIMLPFWHTIPIISSIIAFLNRPRVPKTGKKAKGGADGKDQDKEEKAPQENRKAELKAAAEAVQKRLIPPGSTLEGEMEANLERWNRTLDPVIKQNLTEDVNSLIRDYMRKTIRTIKASTFNRARVENLATALVDTPSLMKIKNRDALLAYTQLYIVQLIRDIT